MNEVCLFINIIEKANAKDEKIMWNILLFLVFFSLIYSLTSPNIKEDIKNKKTNK